MGRSAAGCSGAGDLRRARSRTGRTEAASARIGGISRTARRAGVAARGLKIRPETEADHDAIRTVNDQAFGEPIEARLVEAIRASDRFVPELSLVAERDGEIVGHVILS